MMNDTEVAIFMLVTDQLKKDAQALADLAEQCRASIEKIQHTLERVKNKLDEPMKGAK